MRLWVQLSSLVPAKRNGKLEIVLGVHGMEDTMVTSLPKKNRGQWLTTLNMKVPACSAIVGTSRCARMKQSMASSGMVAVCEKKLFAISFLPTSLIRLRRGILQSSNGGGCPNLS